MALPTAAAAKTYPAAQYAVTLTGSFQFKTISTGSGADWSSTATMPLDGSGTAANNGSIWIPTGGAPSSETVYPITTPYYSIETGVSGTSLVLSEGGTCTDTIIDSLDPELAVTTAFSGGSSLLLDWNGSALPNNPAGNANSFPASCNNPDDATFQINTPLNSLMEGGFDLPWSSGYDTVRFDFPTPSGTAASQTLAGASVSQVATANGGLGFNCFNGSGYTCTESYPAISEQLKLTRICTGTVTPATAAVKISRSRVSGHTAEFTFSAARGTGYQCLLARRGHAVPKLSLCYSPQFYSGLARGSYTFEVRGVNNRGHSKSTTSRRFSIG